MGSAPVRRGFETRMLSSQRRGAPVGPGMPGVYAVRRSRTAQQSTPAPSGPPPAIDEWVQPDDVEMDVTISGVFRTEYGTPDSGSGTYLTQTASLPEEAQTQAFAASADGVWQTVVVKLSADNLSADPVSPSLPPGATGVEYEDPAGVLLAASIAGTLIATADPALPDDPITEVWEALITDLVPGTETSNLPGVYGPDNTTAGNPVFTHTGQGTFTFAVGPQDFDADQTIGWRVSEVHSLNQTAPDETADAGGAYYVTLEGSAVGSQLDVNYTYRPPRYRFTF